MAKNVDIRNYINPHPKCGAEVQKAALDADSEEMEWPPGTDYTEDKTGKLGDAAVRPAREDRKSIVRCQWLFNLAPVTGMAPEKRKVLKERLAAIHKKKGCVFREAATGLQSDDPAALVEMTQRSSKMISDYGKGAAGQTRKGRPKKPRTKTQLDTMERGWFSRRHRTIDAAIIWIENQGVKNVNKNELYRLFGRRDQNSET